jgi:tetratricopeptide (TPR) repeat protein
VSDNNCARKRVGADGADGRALDDEFDGSIAAQRDGPTDQVDRPPSEPAEPAPVRQRAPDRRAERDQARLAAERELALARLALDGDDPARAAVHVAAALAGDPTLADTYDMLRRLDTPPIRARDYFPIVDASDVGVIAACSYLAARAGHMNDALNLLVMAAVTAPEKAWTASGWLDLPGSAEQLDPVDAAETLLFLALRLDDPVDAGLLPTLSPYLDFARRLVEANPGRTEVLAPLSGLARRLGAVEEAVAWCEFAERVAPTPRSAIMLGYAYRSVDRFDDMIAAWRAAVERDPSNVDVHIDLAEHLSRAGRLTDALGWLDRALGVHPSHPRALPIACEMRFRADGNIDHLLALVDYWLAHPEQTYPLDRLARASDGRLWLRLVPPMPGARLDVTTVPAPRPDTADTADTADTTVIDPSPEASDVLCAVAVHTWAHPIDAYERAAPLADVAHDDLLALLTRVPPPPTDDWRTVARTDPGYWPSHARAWVCLGLLHHLADEPWPTSTRRRTLIEIASGRRDTTPESRDGALFALIVAGWRDPLARPDAARVVAARFVAIRGALRRAPVPNAVSIAVLATLTPSLSASLRDDARRLIDVAETVTDLAALSHAARRMFGRPVRTWFARHVRR